MTSSSSGRVWVAGIQTACPFGTSVFDTLLARTTSDGSDVDPSSHRHHYDRMLVSLQEEPKGTLRLNPQRSTSTNLAVVPMGRARHCPRLGSTACPTTMISGQTGCHKKPFVSLAVVGMLLDTTRHHLLLTRRPAYMRSFPGAWVFPGGGVDPHESLTCAVSREVHEETGLVVSDWRVESIWESVYPTQVVSQEEEEDYVMKAHHIVVYLSSQLDHAQGLNLCAVEVDAGTWLSRDKVEEVLRYSCFMEDSEANGPPTTTLPIQTKSSTHQRETSQVQLDELCGIYPHEGKMRGLAQGSLFALQEFYESTWGIPRKSG